MDWADYLRDEAAKYGQLAESAEELSIKQELLDLAAVCEEAAETSRIVCRAANPAMRSATWRSHLPVQDRRAYNTAPERTEDSAT
jgi:hypothetical protein